MVEKYPFWDFGAPPVGSEELCTDGWFSIKVYHESLKGAKGPQYRMVGRFVADWVRGHQ